MLMDFAVCAEWHAAVFIVVKPDLGDYLSG